MKWLLSIKARPVLSTILGVMGIALLGGLAAHLLWPSGSEPAELDREAAKRMLRDAAVARIIAESREPHDGFKPKIIPAPRLDSATAEPSYEEGPLQAPEGYSFATTDGEMAKGRMKTAEQGSQHLVQPGREWLHDPNATADIAAAAAAAGRDWSFGWLEHHPDVRLAEIKPSLAAQGVEVLGAAGNLIRAKLPADPARLAAIMAAPGVHGIGTVPKEVKVPESFAAEALQAGLSDQAPVFITLMTDDPDGRWRRQLESLGVVVAGFDASIRVYTAVLAYGALDAVTNADFVLGVEPIGIVEATHNSAVPAMGADALRTYDGSPGLFSGIGGASVPIAVMDTGLNINHLDISNHRSSICGVNFVSSQPSAEELDLWTDEHGHGTHVTGTIVGNGFVESSRAGMAPAVSHIRFAKVLSRYGGGNIDGIGRGMDFLAQASSCPEAGWSDAAVKPLIVNMSLASTARVFEGRDVGSRKLDATVWSHRQLYVVANSNSSISGFSNYGAAKNSLSVGAAWDSGELASFSSHGPTADGRLLPQVVGTGVSLTSARGGGSISRYRTLSGTSMASPAVAGVAALLMDAVPSYRERPEMVRARLMASAIKPDAWLEDPVAFPVNNSDGPGSIQALYGMGKASARTSALNRNRRDGWRNGASITHLTDGEYAYRNINVPEGASRLDLVMTWDEAPTDAIAGPVLNDLDLWLDFDADCGAIACGEHSSTSRTDNVEWIVVHHPQPGVYRVKVAANRVYAKPPRAALAWTVIRGASTPSLRIEADQEAIQGGNGSELTLNITADAYVAAGTRLHFDCRSSGSASACGEGLINQAAVEAGREDGLLHDLENRSWTYIALGEVAVGEVQTVKVPVDYYGKEPLRLYFTASAWNAISDSVVVDVVPRYGNQEAANEPDTLPDAAPPANDNFANPAAIEGDTGSYALDLLLATTEVGEPSFTNGSERPSGSIWFSWQAPSTGAYRFSLSQDDVGSATHVGEVRFDVFKGSHLASAERIASGSWGQVLFAEQGRTYRFRISNRGITAPLTLQWSAGPRPENDDFRTPTRLEGAAGSIAGSNLGATLERQEAFGDLAATTWFTWRAPNDGHFRFKESTNALRLLVFVGNRIPDLRLVSGAPSSSVYFTARRGVLYRIAVAAPDAYRTGRSFDLSWEESHNPGNQDDFADAGNIGNDQSSSYRARIDYVSSVEPDEPMQTGVRTTWWRWTAPADGRYTWRLDEASDSAMQMAMFSGGELASLQLVGRTGPNITAVEFAADAVADKEYSIALGMAINDSRLYQVSSRFGDLVWGPTPANDSLNGAEPLSGAAGSVTGSNEFATDENGERTGSLGHSSLWWKFEPSASGWYRFSVDDDAFALAVYHDNTDNVGSLNLVRSSDHPLSERTDYAEVMFHAEAGEAYAIRLGSADNRASREFTLRWEATEAPNWLRYIGNLTEGSQDAEGKPVEIRDSNLVFDREGARLYAASSLGLQVFERDVDTGRVTLRQQLEDPTLSKPLIWDAARSRLYIGRACDSEYRRFVWNDVSQALEDDGSVEVSSDSSIDCPDRGSFMSSDGSFLYLPTHGGIDVFAFETADVLRRIQTDHLRAEIYQALISNDDTRVYATTGRDLIVLERDAETGELTKVATAVETTFPWGRRNLLAITGDDHYLFVVTAWGYLTHLFDLRQNPSQPQEVASLRKFWPSGWPWRDPYCESANTRFGSPGIDVLCHGSALVAMLEDGQLVGTDYVSPSQADRYNSPLRDFGTTYGVAFSPDGRHIYASTQKQGMVIFERIGNKPRTEGLQSPTLRSAGPLEGYWVDPDSTSGSDSLTQGVICECCRYRSTSGSPRKLPRTCRMPSR